MSRRPFRFPILLLAAFLLLPYACTDGDGPVGPAGERSAVVGLVASYADVVGVAGSQPINRVRIDVLDASTEESVLDAPVVQDVSPDASADTIPVEVSFEGSVIITVELLHVDGSTETVEWSTRSEPVTIEAGEETAPDMPDLGRGPLENLAVTGVAIDEATTALELGATLALSAEVETSDPDAPPTVFWSSSAEAVATVDDEGVVTGVAAGTSAIVASAGPARDTLEVTVLAPPDVTIGLPAEGATFTEHREVAFEGSAEDVEDGQLTGEALVWTSDLDGQLATGASFATTTLSVGTHEIVLVATDSDDLVGEDTVSVVIESDEPPVATISEPADSSLFVEGTPVTFAGTAEDPEEGVLPDTALAWTSDLDGGLGSGASLTTSGLSAGLHQIVLTGTDSFGNSGTDSIVVEVGGPNTVTGTVFRSNDELGYESVRVRLLSDGSPLDSTLTDGLGIYRFDSIAPGTYTVAVERADLPPFGSFTVGAAEQSVTVALDDVATLDVGFEVPVVELRLVASDTTPTAGDTIRVSLVLRAPEVPQNIAGVVGSLTATDEAEFENGDIVDIPDTWTTDFETLAVGDSEDDDSLVFAVASGEGESPDSVVVLAVDVEIEVFGAGSFLPTILSSVSEIESVDAETGATTELLDFVILDTEPVTLDVVNPCNADPVPIAFGQTVDDALESGDCRIFDRHFDVYSFGMAEQGGARITMSAADFVPFTGAAFPSGEEVFGNQISGRADTTGTTTIPHILPAGSYEIFATSRAVEDTTGFIPHGSYSLTLDTFDGDLDGCQGAIVVAGGVSFGGMLETDDCVDTLAPDAADTTRYLDDYVVFLQAGQTLTAEVVPELDIRLSVWRDGEMLAFETAEAGGSAVVSVSAPSAGFYLFTPHSEHHEGTGSYTVDVSVSGGAAAPSLAPGISQPPRETPRPPGHR